MHDRGKRKALIEQTQRSVIFLGGLVFNTIVDISTRETIKNSSEITNNSAVEIPEK